MNISERFMSRSECGTWGGPNTKMISSNQNLKIFCKRPNAELKYYVIVYYWLRRLNILFPSFFFYLLCNFLEWT